MMNKPLNRPLRVLVFGATGRTGILVVQHVLKAGHHVTAIARNPSAITFIHPDLVVVKGDVLQKQSFTHAMHNVDVVISCVGSAGTKPTEVFSKGMQNIIAAMGEAGVHRIMCMSASALVISPKLPAFYRFVAKYIVQKILKNPYADLRIMEKIVEHSNTDWTILRPPQLTNKPATGSYRFAINSFLEKCLRITRTDLAAFMLQNLTNTTMYKAIVEVAN